MFSTRCTVASSLILLSLAATARAQSSTERSAEELFKEGLQLVGKGNCNDGIKKFEAVNKRQESVGAWINIAKCHELDRRFGSAYEAYRKAALLAEKVKGDERERLARDRMRELQDNIPRVKLTLTERPSTLLVKLDETPVGPDDWSTFINLTPGKHVLSVDAPGYEPIRQEIEVGEKGFLKEIQLPLRKKIEPAPVGPIGPISAVPAAAEPNRDQGTASGGSGTWMKPAGWVMVAVGGAACLTGIGFVAAAAAKKNDDPHSAGTLADIGNISWIGGIVAGTGALFVVLSPKSETSPKVGLSGHGMTVRGTW